MAAGAAIGGLRAHSQSALQRLPHLPAPRGPRPHRPGTAGARNRHRCQKRHQMDGIQPDGAGLNREPHRHLSGDPQGWIRCAVRQRSPGLGAGP